MTDPWVITFGWLVAAILFSAAFRPIGSKEQNEERQIAGRVIWQFFFQIALPILCTLVVLVVPLLFWADRIDHRIWQAIIAGVFIATGWLTSAIFSELANRRAKAEKLRDYHKALYAEIRDALATFYSNGEADEQAEQLLQRMTKDAAFVPFVAREEHSRVYAVLVKDIEVLPRQTIDAIVAYYSLVGSISALAEDIRGERFATLQQERRMTIYSDYVDMRKRAYSYGMYALRLISVYASEGPKAAEAFIREINTLDAGRSDQSQGSE